MRAEKLFQKMVSIYNCNRPLCTKMVLIFAKILFKPNNLINKFLKHPPAFQYTKEIIFKTFKKNGFKNIKFEKVKQINLFYNMVLNFQHF